MYSFEYDDFSIVPIDVNTFFYMAKEYKKNIRYSKEYQVSEDFFRELEYYIANNKKEIVVIDMINIFSYPIHLFSRLNEYMNKLIFYNVENDKVMKMLSEDIDNLIWIEEHIGLLNENSELDTIGKIDCLNARKNELHQIMKDIVKSEEDKIQLLESSGLYSNCYIDVKQLFVNVKNYYFVIFCLAEKISNLNGRIDAFISSSKNGAILANILGGVLDIKEVHLIGVGPRYSMELGDSVDCIKEGKRYVYIFDFMCTGTELKIVSALVNSKKGYLPYAAGVARYKKDVDLQILQNLITLVDTKEIGVNYKIAGEKEDINILKGKVV